MILKPFPARKLVFSTKSPMPPFHHLYMQTDHFKSRINLKKCFILFLLRSLTDSLSFNMPVLEQLGMYRYRLCTKQKSISTRTQTAIAPFCLIFDCKFWRLTVISKGEIARKKAGLDRKKRPNHKTTIRESSFYPHFFLNRSPFVQLCECKRSLTHTKNLAQESNKRIKNAVYFLYVRWWL